MDGIFQLFWLFVIFSSLAPMFQQRMLTYARIQLLRLGDVSATIAGL